MNLRVNKAIMLSVAILILVLSVFFITCCSPTESEKSQLSITSTSIYFTKFENSKILVISNSDSGELSWEITEKPDWIEVSKSSGQVTTGTDTVIVTANYSQAGEYSGTIIIESNGGDKEISVSMNITIWVKKEDMPTARSSHIGATVNGKIYAIGGYLGPSFGYENNVEEYDPATDTWTNKYPLPSSQGEFSPDGCVVNGKIYAIGGFTMPNTTFNTVYVYDPATDTWTTKSPMPTARWGHCPVVVNGKIYVIGGATGWPIKKYYETIEVYNPSTDTWTTEGTILPTPRWLFSCSVVNGKIYAIGGIQTASAFSTVEEYNPATDTWTTKAPMPTARWGLTTAIVNGKIYAIGGSPQYPGNIAFSVVEEYDPVTDTWTTKSSMPISRIVPAAGVVNEKIYVFGGGDDNEVMHTEVYEYEPGIDP